MDIYVVKILGNDMKIYEVDCFISDGKNYKDAIGIVFGSPLIGLRVLAFDVWHEIWGKDDVSINKSHSRGLCSLMPCGLEYTKRIVERQKLFRESTAAKKCYYYDKGGLQWYLPSVLELLTLVSVRDFVNDAMRKIGCQNKYFLPYNDTEMNHVVSSCEEGAGLAWNVSFDSKLSDIELYREFKGVKRIVRAIASIAQPKLTDMPTIVTKNKLSDEELITILHERGYYGDLVKKTTI